MQWTVEFFINHDNTKPVKVWLLELEENTRSKLLRNIDLLERLGLGIREPYVKHLEGKLYELRTKDYKGIYRIIYVAHTGRKFILLHGFMKKTQKTPRKELAIARERLKELENE